MSQTDVKILGISGSLRAKSYNTAALRALHELLPAGVSLVESDISDIPLYNEDVREQGWPPSVERLRRQIAEADALIFSTPEYNYSVPGVLKNAIDWASRPPEQPSRPSRPPSWAPAPVPSARRARSIICGRWVCFSICNSSTSRKS